MIYEEFKSMFSYITDIDLLKKLYQQYNENSSILEDIHVLNNEIKMRITSEKILQQQKEKHKKISIELENAEKILSQLKQTCNDNNTNNTNTK